MAASRGAAADLAARRPHSPLADHRDPQSGLPRRKCSRAPVSRSTIPGSPRANPPVLVAAGTAHRAEGLPTLLRAFRGRARRVRSGSSSSARARSGLGSSGWRGELRVAADMDLPGYVANPYSLDGQGLPVRPLLCMGGLRNALAEALACGAAGVSTDCPSGPAEILGGGRYGRLVPVGDDRRRSPQAILATLDDPPEPERLRSRAREFSLDSRARALQRGARPMSRAATRRADAALLLPSAGRRRAGASDAQPRPGAGRRGRWRSTSWWPGPKGRTLTGCPRGCASSRSTRRAWPVPSYPSPATSAGSARAPCSRALTTPT